LEHYILWNSSQSLCQLDIYLKHFNWTLKTPLKCRSKCWLRHIQTVVHTPACFG
jgi:hypothetical protein